MAVETSHGVIGVELTELNPKGQRRRRHEEEEDKTTQAARERYDAAGHQPLDVKVWWSGDQREETMTRAHRSKRAKSLADFVASHIPGNGQKAFFDAAQEPDPKLPPNVNSIRVVRHLGPGSSWSCPRFAFDHDVAIREVTRAVERKNAKLEG